jgi:hypothetical protein
MSILVNCINFTIKINTINNFLKNYAQTLNDYYFETEGVSIIISSTQHSNTFSDRHIVDPWSDAAIQKDSIREYKNKILM